MWRWVGGCRLFGVGFLFCCWEGWSWWFVDEGFNGSIWRLKLGLLFITMVRVGRRKAFKGSPGVHGQRING